MLGTKSMRAKHFNNCSFKSIGRSLASNRHTDHKTTPLPSNEIDPSRSRVSDRQSIWLKNGEAREVMDVKREKVVVMLVVKCIFQNISNLLMKFLKILLWLCSEELNCGLLGGHLLVMRSLCWRNELECTQPCGELCFFLSLFLYKNVNR